MKLESIIIPNCCLAEKNDKTDNRKRTTTHKRSSESTRKHRRQMMTVDRNFYDRHDKEVCSNDQYNYLMTEIGQSGPL